MSAPGPADQNAEASLFRDGIRELRKKPLFIIALSFVVLFVVMAIAPELFAGWFGHGDPRACDLRSANQGPSAGHPFGLDGQGCDLYSNVIHGARVSIAFGGLVTLLSFVLALVLGTVAGYYGRLPDVFVSRTADIFFGFPFILGALVLLTALQDRSILTVGAVVSLFAWPMATRVMRSSVLQVKTADFVLAARALGARDLRILLRHVIPNAITPLIVLSSLSVGGFIGAEAGLSYLGVGLEYPAISWGLQLSNSQNSFYANPHLLIFPGAFLSVTVISFVLLGDMIRDAFDPKAR